MRQADSSRGHSRKLEFFGLLFTQCNNCFYYEAPPCPQPIDLTKFGDFVDIHKGGKGENKATPIQDSQ